MDDLKKYEEFLNHGRNKASDEMSELLIKASDLHLPKGRGKEDIWKGIEEATEERKSRIVRPLWIYLSAAASLLIFCSVLFYFLSVEPEKIQVSHQTKNGEAKEVMLPDQSKVVLNATSNVTFAEEWDRNVILEGEAFFEVVKGGKFTVITDLGSVEVLGTSFNVVARDSIFEVTCKTGKVQVKSVSLTTDEVLTSGKSIRFAKDTVKRYDISIDLIGTWQSGEFYFNEQRLSSVLREMERQFDVSITPPNSDEYLFDGYFTNKDVNTALEMVCLPLGLSYEKTGVNSYSIRELE